MIIDLSKVPSETEHFQTVFTKILGDTEGLVDITIVLPPGEFVLKDSVPFRTESISHDDGCGEVEKKQSCIFLKGRKGLTLRGSKGENGEPQTVFLVHNDGKAQSFKFSGLWAEDCPKLRLENMEFRLFPPSSYFGTVEEKTEDALVIKPGRMDYPSILPLYCMNRFRDGKLLGKSLTIGFGIDDTMVKRDDGLFVLDSKKIIDEVEVGDNLSWHLSGITDFLVFIGHCDDLVLDNIKISDACGFGMLTECCKNITARKISIRNREGYQPVSRDGWKIFRCAGRVEVSSSWIEGTRMDGQNVHANYLVIKKIDGLKVKAEMKYAPSPLVEGTGIQFYGSGVKGRAKIVSWRILSSEFRNTIQEGDRTAATAVVGKKNRFNVYEIELDDMPAGIVPGCYASLDCFTVDEYICRDSVFRNIAGGGNLIRARKALIEGNTYENIMNAGVLIGAEWDTHAESMNPESVEVKNCSFSNVGFYPRYGERGMAGVSATAQGFGNEPVIGSLVVENCTFFSMFRAIELRNVNDVIVRGNRYYDVTDVGLKENSEASKFGD